MGIIPIKNGYLYRYDMNKIDKYVYSDLKRCNMNSCLRIFGAVTYCFYSMNNINVGYEIRF